MRTVQKMMFLRHENRSGISNKTGKEYSIDNLYFLDEEMQECKLGIGKDMKIDSSKLKQLTQYDVHINIQCGDYMRIDVVDVKPVTS